MVVYEMEETSFLDMTPTDGMGVVTSRDLQKMIRGDQKHIVKCYECHKAFSKYLPGSPTGWIYKEHIKGRVRLFCTWTCLSRNRKKRGKTNV